MGVFLAGIAPGGGPSNIHTKLLNGDLSASVTMTIISTIASIGQYLVHFYFKIILELGVHVLESN